MNTRWAALDEYKPKLKPTTTNKLPPIDYHSEKDAAYYERHPLAVKPEPPTFMDFTPTLSSTSTSTKTTTKPSIWNSNKIKLNAIAPATANAIASATATTVTAVTSAVVTAATGVKK